MTKKPVMYQVIDYLREHEGPSTFDEIDEALPDASRALVRDSLIKLRELGVINPAPLCACTLDSEEALRLRLI